MYQELLSNLMLGLSVAVMPSNLLYCAVGVTLGTILGVVPGIGTLAAMSMLFPLTFSLDAQAGLIMLAGIWYGTTYGGSTASILLNLPGTPANAVTCLDGYPMAKQGRAGVALFMTTIASFFGGCVGIVIVMLFSPLVVEIALKFSSAEYFSLMVLGLIASSVISDGSAIKGIAMVLVGCLLGSVGMDMYTGMSRYTFGVLEFRDGLSLVALAMGLFGAAEIVGSIGGMKTNVGKTNVSFRGMLPTAEEMKSSWLPMLRGTSIGSFFGILPGVGGTVTAFVTYALEKRISKDPSRFGKGAIEGIMSPESANNASDQTSFIPTLTLGIPGSATMGLILGVLVIHGISPGPTLVLERPELFWGVVMSFWIGNILLLLLNIPLIGLWVKLLNIPYRLLYPSVIVFICVGVYTVNYSSIEVITVILFGAMGYGMRLLGYPPAPLLLGFVLGPMLEEHFRRAMLQSRGSFDIFISRPISAVILFAAVVVLGWGIYQGRRTLSQV